MHQPNLSELAQLAHHAFIQPLRVGVIFEGADTPHLVQLYTKLYGWEKTPILASDECDDWAGCYDAVNPASAWLNVNVAPRGFAFWWKDHANPCEWGLFPVALQLTRLGEPLLGLD